MGFYLLPILLTAFVSRRAHAGSGAPGVNCSSINDHLDPLTHKFISSCTETNFCSGPVNGVCMPKRCRRDEFPLEYQSGDVPKPPMCEQGFFCPDEGSGCKQLMQAGSMCQLGRDEQCAPPLDWEDLASKQNFNGSICLGSPCMF